MQLIDRYISEVGYNLPENMRADIEKEIRSTIEDTLEDESLKTGRAPDEAMVIEVLKRLGPPDRIAASYLPPRYLIGPELYPYFITVLRIVISIVIILAALATGVDLAETGSGAPQNIFELILTVVTSLIQAMISAAGTVVIVFAILQYFNPRIKGEDKTWNPRTLLEEPDPERVSVPGTLFDIVFTTLALIVFNLYPQWIGFFSNVNGEWVHASILSDAFFRYLPLLNLLWALELGLHLWLLARGKWSNAHRWFKAGLTLLFIAILAWMLTGPSLFALRADDMARLSLNLGANTIRDIGESLILVSRLILGITLAFQVVELGKLLYKTLRLRLPEPVIAKK